MFCSVVAFCLVLCRSYKLVLLELSCPSRDIATPLFLAPHPCIIHVYPGGCWKLYLPSQEVASREAALHEREQNLEKLGPKSMPVIVGWEWPRIRVGVALYPGPCGMGVASYPGPYGAGVASYPGPCGVGVASYPGPCGVGVASYPGPCGMGVASYPGPCGVGVASYPGPCGVGVASYIALMQ